jgi:hypothetical protein
MMKQQEIERLIERYGIHQMPDGRLGMRQPLAGDKARIIALRDDISAHLRAQRDERERKARARQELEERIGLCELRAILDSWDSYRRDFARAMQRGEGWLPAEPKESAEDAAARLPLAALYLRAENEALRPGAHGAIGQRTLDAIHAGMGIPAAIAQMEAEIAAEAERRAWD